MTQREEFEAWLAIAKSNRSHMPSISDLMFEAWQAAKAQAVPQWIPVSDSLPEHKDGLWSDPVIAMTDTGNIYRLSYCGGWQRTSEFMASGSSKVTHWMPLPPAPEQNK